MYKCNFRLKFVYNKTNWLNRSCSLRNADSTEELYGRYNVLFQREIEKLKPELDKADDHHRNLFEEKCKVGELLYREIFSEVRILIEVNKEPKASDILRCYLDGSLSNSNSLINFFVKLHFDYFYIVRALLYLKFSEHHQ